MEQQVSAITFQYPIHGSKHWNGLRAGGGRLSGRLSVPYPRVEALELAGIVRVIESECVAFSTLSTGRSIGTPAHQQPRSGGAAVFQYTIHGSKHWNLRWSIAWAPRLKSLSVPYPRVEALEHEAQPAGHRDGAGRFQYPIHGSKHWNPSIHYGVNFATGAFSTLSTGRSIGTSGSVTGVVLSQYGFQYPIHGSKHWNSTGRTSTGRTSTFQYPIHGSKHWNAHLARMDTCRLAFQYPIHGSKHWNRPLNTVAAA